MYGDNQKWSTAPRDGTWDRNTGLDNDGDDIIDVQDSDTLAAANVWGQGGNDKIFGGLIAADGEQNLNGGDGDDKIWTYNPGQSAPAGSGQTNTNAGQDGDDIIYGARGTDYLYGDFVFSDQKSAVGGDDTIYTGEGSTTSQGDFVSAGFGDDKVYGQGAGEHVIQGNWGDDKIWGGEGKNAIWGDDGGASHFDEETLTWNDYGLESGDDTLYGGELQDRIDGGAGHDYIHGLDGGDYLYGGSGEDTIWGGAGNDFISTGKGWDTVFGGDGCDWIFSEDGGDVLWGGECEPNATEGDPVDGTTQ